MNLLVSTNDNYVIPLTVLLQSVFDHHEEPLHIWFLWSELSEDNRAFFRDLVQDHGSDITYVPVEEAAFRDLPRATSTH